MEERIWLGLRASRTGERAALVVNLLEWFRADAVGTYVVDVHLNVGRAILTGDLDTMNNLEVYPDALGIDRWHLRLASVLRRRELRGERWTQSPRML